MEAPTPPAHTYRNLFGVARWAVVVPLAAALAIALGKPTALPLVLVTGALLAGAIMAAVYHAEVLAKIGPMLDGDDHAWLEKACAPIA